MNNFYSLLGKTLGLTIIGLEALGAAEANGAGSLLQPGNLVALITAVETTLAAK